MTEKTLVLNIRVDEHQARWLRKLAEAEHGGNLSAAARQTISDSWMLRRCRDGFAILREEGFSFPLEENGTTRAIEFFLSPIGAKSQFRWTEEDEEWI